MSLVPRKCRSLVPVALATVSIPDGHPSRLPVLHTDRTVSPNKPHLWIPLVIWSVFLAGLALQLFSPHLGIAHDAFVIPPDLASHGSIVDPRALVQKERLIQSFSALLALAGAVGLAVYYRRSLLKHLHGKEDQ